MSSCWGHRPVVSIQGQSVSPCGRRPHPGVFTLRLSAAAPAFRCSCPARPSGRPWGCVGGNSCGESRKGAGSGPRGAGGIRGCRQGGSACSGKFENEEGEGELVRYCSRGLQTGLTLEQAAIVNSGFHDGGGLWTDTPRSRVPVHPHSTGRVPPASSHGPSPPDSQSDTRPAGFLNLLPLSTSHRGLSGPTVSSRPARVSLPSPRPAEARPCQGSTSIWRPAATQGGPLRAPSSPGSSRSSQHVLRDVEAGRATSLHGPPESLSLSFQARGGWPGRQMPTASPIGNPGSVTSDASN